ncbi:non-ribosomal peptide synthetase, partial [Caballeronia cordobensis]|uniref:non-ribosomal peptide synthetase n=1 Tax=Caballeronia cordobensis TaxID=1353886 RepID=UPI000AD31028
PAPTPFRNLIAHTRLNTSQEAHERFFRDMLADVAEPTLPFGLTEVHRDGSHIEQTRLALPVALNDRLRTQARTLGVSLASLCHLAWARVLAALSAQRQVVFGTVLFGRMHAGANADHALGLYINSLPVCLNVDATSVIDSVRHTHARLSALLAHEHAPLALAQRCSNVPASTPLFSALLNYRHNAMQRGHAWEGFEVVGFEERTHYPLTLSIDDNGASLTLSAQVAAPVSAERVGAYMQQALDSLVEALESAPAMPVDQLDILPHDERAMLIETFNDTTRPFSEHRCIHQLFEDQVRRTPDAVALVFADTSLTYSALNARANRLAHRLISLGVTPDTPVALCVERSVEMVISLLAILKSGGAYVPLDPDYPRARLSNILHDAAPLLLIADAAGRNALGDTSSHTRLDPRTPLALSTDDPRIPELTSRNLAYVIYTSGSTGAPKGALNEHRALVNRLSWMQRAYRLKGDDAVLQKTPFGFDVSVWEFFWTLLNGATLVMAPPGAQRDPIRIAELVCKHRITVAHFVPSMLASFVQTAEAAQCTTLRRLITSGEALSAPLIGQLQQTLPDVCLANLYGPTEAAIDVTAWDCPQSFNDAVVPIGRPIDNTSIYLLDAARRPVPMGATGEIYIGGAGVARGYLNRPELTAERFLADPYSDETDARMYRTGDLARYLPDGNIAFLGRNDHQVKIRGFRIECGEIEAALASHDAVREAVVIAREERLVAYVTTKVDVIAATLRMYLAARLPDYMVPAAFVIIDSLPLTPNGKLDRNALPAPAGDAFVQRDYAAPQGDTETTLAALWSELLGIGRIGRHDHFFELGGHSLMAVTLIARLKQAGLCADVRTLFDTPVLSDLAAKLDKKEHTNEVVVPENLITAQTRTLTPQMLPLIDLNDDDIARIIERVPGGLANVQDIYALSPLQEGMLFHYLLDTQGDPYFMIARLAFDDRSVLDAYLDAVRQAIRRHDILRTAFIWEGLSTPAQVVWRDAPLSVKEVELTVTDEPAIEQLARHFDARTERLDLTRAPLLRFVVAREPGTGRWLALQLLHHLIDDATSLRLLFAEIHAFMADRGHTLPAPMPFRNLVAQARLGISQEEHERFFRDMLAGVTEPTLPFGLTEVRHDGRLTAEADSRLPDALQARLRTQARRRGVSLASLCHLAWARVLAAASGQQQVVFGTVLFGRMHAGAGADHALGLFVNSLPVCLNIDASSVGDSVRDTHARLSALLAHEHAPLTLAQRASTLPAATPLFSALLNCRNNAALATDPQQRPESWRGVQILDFEERTNYPLTLSIDDDGNSLALNAQVVAPIAPERVCGYMQQALESLVQALESAPDTPVGKLDILPRDEHILLLERFNDTAASIADHRCIHQFFEAQAARNPDATAVVLDDTSLTYAALNARANRLAHRLIRLGVTPDTRVALCMDRSIELMIALLAILKAGGAYVPLDPAYPGDRLAFILNDAAPALLITDAAGRAALGDTGALPVIDPYATSDEPAHDPLIDGLISQHLAYIIYTSGSTGTPKGVMVEHRQVVRLLDSTRDTFGFDDRDVWCLFHSFAFDFSVWEIWGAWRFGGKLVIVPRDIARSAPDFMRLAGRHGVTVLNQTPSAFKALIDADAHGQRDDLASLRYVIFGGEALEPSMLRAWYERHAERAPQLVNMYGITETTVHVTCRMLGLADCDRSGSPIGKRIADLKLYLLDAEGQPVPLGASGELYVGGAGVARGYLNRPELTAARFLDDRFSNEPGARMYRTGDLARYTPDGDLEFLGRNDHQVKIRGFRIECGEIEAALQRLPQVAQAAVIAREDTPGNRQLVAYVVPSEGQPARDVSNESTCVNEWQHIYDALYRDDDATAFGDDFRGWASSYTQQPIALDDMRSWRKATVDRIRALAPRRVLEIGVGSGLILSQLAPFCETYHATDLSAETVRKLRRQLQTQPEWAARVQLRAQPAHDFSGLPAGYFDTVILNSVIQYFPTTAYLLDVVEQALKLLVPGGALFIGDIRNLDLLRCFIGVTELCKSPRLGCDELRRHIESSIAADKELLLAPEFFARLPQHLPDIGAVDIQVKRGDYSNELSRYRYDVVLHKSPVSDVRDLREVRAVEWRDIGNMQRLRAVLRDEKADALRVTCMPDARLLPDLLAWQALQGGDEPASVHDAHANWQWPGDIPRIGQLEALAAEAGRDLGITWGALQGTLDIVFWNASSHANH